MSGDSKWSVRFPVVIGLATCGLLFTTVGFWGATATLSGAVIAHGKVEVSNNSQVVQHPDGGVVAQIQHRDGDFVSAGDILVRLDDTFLQSELSALDRRLVELSARRARLEAERDGSPSFQFTYDL